MGARLQREAAQMGLADRDATVAGSIRNHNRNTSTMIARGGTVVAGDLKGAWGRGWPYQSFDVAPFAAPGRKAD